MIPISDAAASILAGGTYTLYTRCESWKGADLLDGGIPIGSGLETVDVTLRVPESLELTVPRLYNGVSYVPGSDINHPLACWGQRLHVNLGVGMAGGMIEWIRRSWFYVTDAKVDGDSVFVTAAGLLGLIDEAALVSPVTASGTYKSMLRQLVSPTLTVDFTNAPADRAVPSGTTWDDNRLDAVNDLLDTWPANAYIDENGTLIVVPVGDTAVSSLALTDGVGGTTMEWGADVSRDGAANAVVARGYDATGANVQAVAYDLNPLSPTFLNGDFNGLAVPYVYFSPLLTTVAQCQAAANTILARRMAEASRTLTTDAVPYLALQARDGVTVTSTTLGVASTFGVVDQLTMPLTAGDGAMTLGVRIS